MHRIALKGPWQITHPHGNVPPVSHKLPATWQELFGDCSGSAQFLRHFHKPTNLDASEIVYLTLTGCRGEGEVFLNEHLVGHIWSCDVQWSVDITRNLLSRNELRIKLHHDPVAMPQPGGLYGVVELQIVNHVEG